MLDKLIGYFVKIKNEEQQCEMKKIKDSLQEEEDVVMVAQVLPAAAKDEEEEEFRALRDEFEVACYSSLRGKEAAVVDLSSKIEEFSAKLGDGSTDKARAINCKIMKLVLESIEREKDLPPEEV